MTFAEAIRLGSVLRPQAFGDTFGTKKRWFRKPVQTSCALGAAIEAAGVQFLPDTGSGTNIPVRGAVSTGMAWMFPPEWNFTSAHELCPVCRVNSTIIGLVEHLNDYHKWSRQDIAEWVEPVEVRLAGVRA